MKEYFYLEKKVKKKILNQIALILKKKEEIVFAYCYGSFLEEKTKFRDIDLALYLKTNFKGDFFDYEQELSIFLERKLKYPIDVKILNKAPFSFLNNVFRSGKLLFCRDENLLVDLIENSSLQTLKNYELSLRSFKELAF